jgi:hypothetical protein
MATKITDITNELLRELIVHKNSLSVSLYMPTHRSHPTNLQDIILYKNLLKQLKESLQVKFSEQEVHQLINPFNELIQDQELWNKTLDGLVIFSTKDYFKLLFLQVPVEPLVIVSESFHTKPLRQYAQSKGRFHVLSLNLDQFQLYEGNRYGITEIELDFKIPKTLKQALGEELTDKHSTVASYGGTGMQTSTMHHGHGGKKDQIDNDVEKFFRIISLAIHEHYSQPTGLPLILAALPEHHHLFQKVNKNPLLQKDGVWINSKILASEKLAEMAFDIVQRNYLNKIKELCEKFEGARWNNNASDNLEEVTKAVAAGRVETLLLEQNRIIPGKIVNRLSGTIETADLKDLEMGDLLNSIAEIATEKGTTVLVVSKEDMPSRSGLVALYRY